jgi:orotate phosphoribosyltransferase
MNQAEIAELLSNANALLNGHFKLSSGLHSPQYLQCAVALQHPDLAETLGAELAERWRSGGVGAATAVFSPALGGVVIGQEVGRGLGVRACFTERVGGEMVLRRGFAVDPGEKILVIEDVITTGKSTLETVRAIEAHGGDPIGVGCIANRSGNDTVGDLPLVALVTLDIPTYEPNACPLCDNRVPIEKPGSRKEV